MYKELIEEKREQFNNAIEHFKREMMRIRTGRATPMLVEDIKVESYGAMMPLKQIANISVPEPRQLLIAPWDNSMLPAIEKAIKAANIGVQPNNDGATIRITLPALTEEQRKELVKVLGRRAEDARVAVRNVREDIWKAIQEAEKVGDISEDEKFSAKDALQEVVDEYNAKIESLRKEKEEEIMTV